MADWFRFYGDAVNDPKVQRLSPALFKAWVNVLCIASKHDGCLPPIEDLAFTLRVSEKQAGDWVDQLISAGLLDETETGVAPHNWNARQYKSDVSTERVKQFRERRMKRSGNVSSPFQERQETVSETPSESETDTEQIQSRTDSAPVGAEERTAHAEQEADHAGRPQRKTRRQLRYRIPDDWQPDADDREYAAARGLDPDRVAERFRVYWIGCGKPMASWKATWQRWCLTEADRGGSRGNGPTRGGETGGGVIASARRVLAALERDEPV